MADRDEPNSADGQMNGQEMPTTDGQMASNTSEEVEPPTLGRAEEPKWGADTGDGGPGVSGHEGAKGADE